MFLDSDDRQLQKMLKGMDGQIDGKAVPEIHELRDPENLVPLAVVALRQIYPDIAPLLLSIVARKALIRLVNITMDKRERQFKDHADNNMFGE